MITESTIYWITRLDSLNVVFCVAIVFATLFAAACCGLAFEYHVEHDKDEEDYAPKIKLHIRGALRSLAVLMVLLLVKCLVPTTKEMLLIKGVPAVVNSNAAKCVTDDMSRLYKQLVKIIEENIGDKQ